VNFITNSGKQTPACPSDERGCKLKAFLVPGDVALIIVEDGPYVCATYKSPRGVETSGWLPHAALSLTPPEPVQDKAWEGKWRRDGEAEIALKAHGNDMEAAGQATWGGTDPENVRQSAVQTGEISGAGKPRDGILTVGYGDRFRPPPYGPDCAARLRLFGRYLVVEDNGACGGMNVSFSGIYVGADGER
jgi:hypothetical protein